MSDVYDPPERVATESHCRGMNKYNEMYNESLDDPKKFWGRICQQFYWKSPIPDGKRKVETKSSSVERQIFPLEKTLRSLIINFLENFCHFRKFPRMKIKYLLRFLLKTYVFRS